MIWFNVVIVVAVLTTVVYGFYSTYQTRAFWRKVYSERNDANGGH